MAHGTRARKKWMGLALATTIILVALPGHLEFNPNSALATPGAPCTPPSVGCSIGESCDAASKTCVATISLPGNPPAPSLKKADGEKCADDSECMSGFCPEADVCRVKKDIGAPCAAHMECNANPHLVCLKGACALGKDMGDKCDSHDECRDAYVCLLNDKCGAQLPYGEDCTANVHCKADLKCSLTGVCVDCVDDSDCDTGKTCSIKGQCVDPATPPPAPPPAPAPPPVVTAPPPPGTPPPPPPNPTCKKNADCVGLLACDNGACIDPCQSLPRQSNESAEMGCVYATMGSRESVPALRERLRGMNAKAREAHSKELAVRYRQETWDFAPWRFGDAADTSLTPDNLYKEIFGGKNGNVQVSPMAMDDVLAIRKADATVAEVVGARVAARGAIGSMKRTATSAANAAKAEAAAATAAVNNHLNTANHAMPADPSAGRSRAANRGDETGPLPVPKM